MRLIITATICLVVLVALLINSGCIFKDDKKNNNNLLSLLLLTQNQKVISIEGSGNDVDSSQAVIETTDFGIHFYPLIAMISGGTGTYTWSGDMDNNTYNCDPTAPFMGDGSNGTLVRNVAYTGSGSYDYSADSYENLSYDAQVSGTYTFTNCVTSVVDIIMLDGYDGSSAPPTMEVTINGVITINGEISRNMNSSLIGDKYFGGGNCIFSQNGTTYSNTDLTITSSDISVQKNATSILTNGTMNLSVLNSSKRNNNDQFTGGTFPLCTGTTTQNGYNIISFDGDVNTDSVDVYAKYFYSY